MDSRYLQVTALDDARRQLIDFMVERCSPLGEERVPTQQASGRILSRAVYAGISAPHFYASAMDGIAMRARDGFGASETTPVVLQDYAVVDTGDPIPEGYDCVVMVEDVIEQDAEKSIVSAPKPWQYIRQIGEDIVQGEMAFPSYTKLTPAGVGTLLSCGVTEVDVMKTPLVGIIPTGDEIVQPKTDPAEGEILEFNSTIYTGMLEEWGAAAQTYPIVPDELEQIERAVARAAEECDAVILIAGSSKGRGDFAYQALNGQGTVLLHGVAIRPGKPVILAEVKGKPAFGMPGYPVSGVVAMRELLKPALEALTHCPLPDAATETAVLSRKIVSPLKYEEFIRCKLADVGERLVAVPLAAGASIVSSFAKSDGIIRVPQSAEMLEEGSEVQVELTRERSYIRNTISIVGSHDPMFDEISDILERKQQGIHLASSHVGSMGAIMAIRRGEAHAGGIHLMDTQTGEYNISYLKQYFPQGGVRLLRGVGRQQGLMVAPGNPMGIEGVQDIAREGLRYVNRQRGAGTRILLDYLLEQNKIQPQQVYGYEREELTHLAVAVQIASGGADAGMGIYSAAQAFGLGFIPIYMERYDILVNEAFSNDARCGILLDALRSVELKQRLEKLGGYQTDGIGEWIDWEEGTGKHD